mgnify:CR=1 FL=1
MQDLVGDVEATHVRRAPDYANLSKISLGLTADTEPLEVTYESYLADLLVGVGHVANYLLYSEEDQPHDTPAVGGDTFVTERDAPEHAAQVPAASGPGHVLNEPAASADNPSHGTFHDLLHNLYAPDAPGHPGDTDGSELAPAVQRSSDHGSLSRGPSSSSVDHEAARATDEHEVRVEREFFEAPAPRHKNSPEASSTQALRSSGEPPVRTQPPSWGNLPPSQGKQEETKAIEDPLSKFGGKESTTSLPV